MGQAVHSAFARVWHVPGLITMALADLRIPKNIFVKQDDVKKGVFNTRTGYRLCKASQQFRPQHGLFLRRRVGGARCQIAIRK